MALRRAVVDQSQTQNPQLGTFEANATLPSTAQASSGTNSIVTSDLVATAGQYARVGFDSFVPGGAIVSTALIDGDYEGAAKEALIEAGFVAGGAAIGSIVPGVGTAIGAGVGWLAARGGRLVRALPRQGERPDRPLGSALCLPRRQRV